MSTTGNEDLAPTRGRSVAAGVYYLIPERDIRQEELDDVKVGTPA